MLGTIFLVYVKRNGSQRIPTHELQIVVACFNTLETRDFLSDFEKNKLCS